MPVGGLAAGALAACCSPAVLDEWVASELQDEVAARAGRDVFPAQAQAACCSPAVLDGRVASESQDGAAARAERDVFPAQAQAVCCSQAALDWLAGWESWDAVVALTRVGWLPERQASGSERLAVQRAS